MLAKNVSSVRVAVHIQTLGEESVIGSWTVGFVLSNDFLLVGGLRAFSS